MTRFPGDAGSSVAPLGRLAELVTAYGPAAFILTLPLEFTSVYLRQQLSRFVLAVVMVAFLYSVITRRRAASVPRSISLVLLALYVAASLASWAVTRAPGSSNSLLDLALYPVVALVLANMVASESDHRRAWNAFMVSALAIALLGLFLFLTHLAIWTPNRLVAARLNITFGDPNITARFLTLGACVAILMFGAQEARDWLCVATAVGCAVVLPLTLSRSGLALFVLTAVLAVVVAFQRRRAASLAAIALIAFVIATAANPITRQRAEDAAATLVSAVTGKPASFGPSQSSVVHNQYAAEDNRVYLIRAGLQMFKDHPVTGVGFGGYQRALLTTYRGLLPSNLTTANLDTLSHASLVTVMAEQGVLGTLLFLAFLLALGVEAWRARSAIGEWAVWATIPAALIAPIFIYSQIEGRFIQEPYFWPSLGLLYSAFMRRREVASSETEPAVKRRRRVELA